MMSQFVLVFSAEAWRHFVFFLEAWGLFGIFLAWERPWGLSKAKKIPKRPKAESKKTNCLRAEVEKPEKKLTYHENKPAFFLSEVAYSIYAHLSMNTIFHIKD